jgi:hypothetical protein
MEDSSQLSVLPSNSVPAARNEQSNFVLEALLPAQQRKDFLLDQLGKRHNAIGLQTEGDTTNKHTTSSVAVAKRRGGQSDLVQVIRRVGRKAQSVSTVGQLSLIVKEIIWRDNLASQVSEYVGSMPGKATPA